MTGYEGRICAQHGEVDSCGPTKTVEVLELFTFVDGVRLAWVTWLLGDGERRAISVRELAR